MPPSQLLISRSYKFISGEFAPVVRVGFVQIDHADKLPVIDAYWTWSARKDAVTLRLSGANGDVMLHMHRLPGGNAEFERICKWYGERKTRVRLPEGGPFNLSHLALLSLPPGWQHDGWARSRTDLIHTYQTAGCGMLMRMVGNPKSLLTHPLLVQVQQNVRLLEDQWVTDPPEDRPKEDFVSPFKDTPLDDETKAEMQQATSRGLALLGLKPQEKPHAVQEALQQQVDTLRARSPKLKPVELDSLSVDLGVLWGQALCDSVGWEWRQLENDTDKGLTAVCSPNRAYRVNPFTFLHRILKDTTNSNTSLLFFNMVCAGDLPGASAGSFVPLG